MTPAIRLLDFIASRDFVIALWAICFAIFFHHLTPVWAAILEAF